MDKGMKKVVNLVTNYMSALIEAGTAVYFPGGGAAEVIESPEDCARVLNEISYEQPHDERLPDHNGFSLI